jgi:hypothetical protein
MYDLQNTGRSVRVVFDRHHVEHVIDIGATKKNVDMREEEVEELLARKDQLVPRKSDGTAEPAPQSQSSGDQQPSADPPGRINRHPAPPAEVDAKQAKALIEQADGMEFNSWKEQAQKVLGDKWPGGSPKKSSIVELLRQEAK